MTGDTMHALQSMWGRSGPTVTDSAFHLRFIVTNEEDRQREFEGNFDPKAKPACRLSSKP